MDDVSIKFDADTQSYELGQQRMLRSNQQNLRSLTQIDGAMARIRTLQAQQGRELAKIEADLAAAHQKRLQTIQHLSQGMVIAGGLMLAGFGAAGKAAADFDRSMDAVGAATMAGAAAMDKLEASALAAGASTAFSATEAAAAQTELAKAGVKVTDIINGGLQGALDLAAAGQLEVAEAAEIAATALTVFGLSGAQMSHVADLLAAGAGKAQGSVSDLAKALEYAGLPASGLEMSIEQTTATLALFASQGLVGEKAGTSFRSMLVSMTNPVGKTRQLMEDLGLSFFDASGQFVGMGGVAQRLQEQLGGLTPEVRNAALAQIFGNEALGAAQALYREGAAGIQEWTENVNDAGYAAEQAAKLNDNLAGDVEKLGGAFSTSLIKGGTGANEVLRFMVQRLTDLVETVADLPTPVLATATAFLGLVGAGTTVLGVTGSLIPKIAAAREAIAGLGAAGDLANRGLGAMGKVAGYASVAAVGFGLLSGAVSLLSDPIEIVTRDTDVLVSELTELGAAATDVAAKAANFDLGHLATQLSMVTREAETIIDRVPELGLLDLTVVGLDDPVAKSWEQARVSIEETDDALSSMISGGSPEAAVSAFTRIAEAAELEGVTINQLAELYPGYVAALQTYVGQSTYTVDASGNVTNALGEQADAADLLKERWDALNGIAVDIVSAQADWTIALDGLKKGAEDASVSLDLNTVAGATNAQQMVSLAEDAQNLAAAIGNRDGYDAGIAAAAEFRQSLIDQAVAAGYDRGEIETLIGQIFNLDNTGSTSDLIVNDQVNPAVDKARKQLQELDGTGATVTITTINRLLNARPTDFAGTGGGLPGLPKVTPPRAGGGRIVGPGGPRQDNLLTPTSNGEFVVNAAAVEAAGLRNLEALNEGRFRDLDFSGRGGGHYGSAIAPPIAQTPSSSSTSTVSNTRIVEKRPTYMVNGGPTATAIAHAIRESDRDDDFLHG